MHRPEFFTPAIAYAPPPIGRLLKAITALCTTAPAGFGPSDPVIALSRRFLVRKTGQRPECLPELDLSVHRALTQTIAGQSLYDELSPAERSHFSAAYDVLHRHKIWPAALEAHCPALLECDDLYLTLVYLDGFAAVFPSRLTQALRRSVDPAPCLLILPEPDSNHARIELSATLTRGWKALEQVLNGHADDDPDKPAFALAPFAGHAALPARLAP